MSIILNDPKNRILAIDPGINTGFASWTLNKEECRAWEIRPEKDLHDVVLSEIHGFLPNVIVCESFDHRQKDKVEQASIELIGIVKWYVSRKQILVVFQTPSYGKGYFDNAKLKQLKLYIPGMPHAMDARRHLMQFRMKHGLFDLRKLKV